MAENDNNASENGSRDFDVHAEVVSLLIEKIRRDPYPSGTMMDFVEELLTPEVVPAYAAVLMEKISADEFPSLDMMARLRDLA